MNNIGDLSGRTSRGAAVTLGGDLFVKGLAIVAIVVVARVLDAESYGSVVLALVIFGFADVLSNPALQTTLLREPDLQDSTIDAAWTISMVRGVLLTTAFWFLAPWLASWWPEQQALLQGYFQILSFTFALTGLQNLHMVRLRRQMRFLRAFLIESVSPLSTSLFAITALCWTSEPVWLVVAPLVGAALGSVASLLVVSHRPRLSLGGDDVRRLWSFSRPLMLNGLMVYVLFAGDDVFVAGVAGTVALGIYSMSYRWSHVGVKFVVHGLQNVLIPSYGMIRDDLARTRHAVALSLSMLTAVCGVVSGLFLAFSSEFFYFIGGGRWEGAGIVAKALVPFVMAHGINGCLTPVFLVHGKPHWLTGVIAAKLVIFFPMLYLGFACFGLTGVALAVSTMSIGVSVVLMYLTNKLIGIEPRVLAQAVVPPLCTAGLSALLGWLAVLPSTDPTLRLFVGAGVSIISFFVVWELFCRHPMAQRMPPRSFREIAGMLTR